MKYVLILSLFFIGCSHIPNNSAEIENLNDRILILEGQAGLTEAQINEMQLQLNDLQANVTELQTNENVAEFIDPCGDYPGHYDEILIRMSSGKLVAFFESGGRRFLTILTPGNYQTTDQQRCNFTLLANGQVL